MNGMRNDKTSLLIQNYINCRILTHPKSFTYLLGFQTKKNFMKILHNEYDRKWNPKRPENSVSWKMRKSLGIVSATSGLYVYQYSGWSAECYVLWYRGFYLGIPLVDGSRPGRFIGVPIHGWSGVLLNHLASWQVNLLLSLQVTSIISGINRFVGTLPLKCKHTAYNFSFFP